MAAKKKPVFPSLRRRTFFSRPATWLVIGLIVFLVVLFQLTLRKQTQNRAPAPQQVRTPPKQEPAKPVNTGEDTAGQTIELGAEDLQGVAPVAFRNNNPILGQDKDPELAALAEALRIRIEMLSGAQTSHSANRLTQRFSGVFHDFRILCVRQNASGQVNFSEITVQTPSRGMFRTRNRILDFVQKTDYEKIKQDLLAADLTLHVNPFRQDGLVKVQLEVLKPVRARVPDDFLITAKGIGKVELGESMATARWDFPRELLVLEKELLHRNQVTGVLKVQDQESNETLLYVYGERGKVNGLAVLSARYQTEKGIGIGSTLGAIRILCAKVKIGITARGLPFVRVSDLPAYFLLQEEGFQWSKHIFPNSLQVESILLGDPTYLEE